MRRLHADCKKHIQVVVIKNLWTFHMYVKFHKRLGVCICILKTTSEVEHIVMFC